MMKRQKKKLSELNLIDNFLFNVLMSHEIYGPRTAKIILSTIIGRDVQIRKLETEKIIVPPDSDRHGIRLDAYVEEEQTDVSQGDVFDIEPDNKKTEKRTLPRRARYYHSRMDSKTLEASESYDKLPNAWVIFITSFDPFSEGRMVYTIKKRCVELPEMIYDDGVTTLFLNVTGNSDNVSQDLKELLAYMKDTSSEKAVNSNLKEIQKCIDKIKAEPSTGEIYMTLGEYIKYEVDEGIAEVLAELTDAREEAKNAREEAKNAREEAKNAREELKNAREEADNAREEADNARADADNARADADNARADADNARADADNANVRADKAEAAVAEAKKNLLSAQAEIEKLKAELQKYRS